MLNVETHFFLLQLFDEIEDNEKLDQQLLRKQQSHQHTQPQPILKQSKNLSYRNT